MKGGDFSGQNLTLISKTGKLITKETLMSNNFIKLHFCYTKNDTKSDNAPTPSWNDASYPTVETPKTWDIWHCCFTHISISSLHRLFNKQLVTGFHIDCESTFSDCIAYTKAKQSVILFNKTAGHDTELGELTHIDIWGKYSVSSINSFQYYLLMVVNASCYITVKFLKSKDQATQKLKNYFTHLQIQRKTPKAICIDHRCEFVNDLLLK